MHNSLPNDIQDSFSYETELKRIPLGILFDIEGLICHYSLFLDFQSSKRMSSTFFLQLEKAVDGFGEGGGV